jgi:Zn-dependent protease
VLSPGNRTRQYQVLALVLAVALIYLVLRGHLVSVGDFLFLACLIPSVILHEVSHGAVALACGDDTAKRAGRLTLNPLRHVDPFGTIILPALLILVGAPVIGYAKPVPVNVGNLRSPRNQGVLVALVGPAVNVALALLAAFLLRYPLASELNRAFETGSGALPWWLQLVVDFGEVNVILAMFNLVPIPPLDGSAVVERLLPAQWWPAYLSLRRYTMPVLFLVFFFAPQVFAAAIDPAISLWAHLAQR